MNTKPTNVDAYIKSFSKETQILLQQVRDAIKLTAPMAEEIISYNMPGYKLNGMLVWFAGYKNHIGFYPSSSGIANFKDELSIYKNAKGSVQFPINKPMPLALIKKIVNFRIKENKDKIKLKKK